jgi:hypothetical protein
VAKAGTAFALLVVFSCGIPNLTDQINRGKKMDSKATRLSQNLKLALSELEDLGDLGIKFVPWQPSPTMIEAGARAGGVDNELAAKIYRAMLEADAMSDREETPDLRAN